MWCARLSSSSAAASVVGRARRVAVGWWLARFDRDTATTRCAASFHAAQAMPAAQSGSLSTTPTVNLLVHPSPRIAAALQQRSPLLRSVMITKDGVVMDQESSKADLCKRLGVGMRDMRALDPAYPRVFPQVLVRDSNFIVKLDVIRAVISADAISVFDPLNPSVQLVLHPLQERLAESAVQSASDDEARAQPFEFRAFEEVLVNLCSSMDRQWRELLPAITEETEQLLHTKSPAPDLERLLVLSKKLRSFTAELQLLIEALESVTTDEETMASMYLTEKQQQLPPREEDDTHEVEELVESYLFQLEQISSEAQQLRNHVAATQEFVNTTLDTFRNRILRLTLLLNVGTFSLGTAGGISAAWGMNLQVPFEDASLGFFYVAGALTVTGSAMFMSLYTYCRRNGIL